MAGFTRLEGLVAWLDRNNGEPEAILPKRFPKAIRRSGFGPNAFDEWRCLDVGQPGQDNSGRRSRNAVQAGCRPVAAGGHSSGRPRHAGQVREFEKERRIDQPRLFA